MIASDLELCKSNCWQSENERPKEDGHAKFLQESQQKRGTSSEHAGPTLSWSGIDENVEELGAISDEDVESDDD